MMMTSEQREELIGLTQSWDMPECERSEYV